MRSRLRPPSAAIFVGAGALAWLVLISWAHLRLNQDSEARPTLRMGYMPLVTNLSAPLLDEASARNGGTRFEAIKFSSFADMGAALRDGHIDAAFMIAPLAIVLHEQGVPLKVVSIGNRHESTLVARKDLAARSLFDLRGRKVAVPMRYSPHNLALRRWAQEDGLRPGDIDIVEMNPPDMGAALRTGELDAYFVGEPFAALAVLSGDAAVVHYVEERWPGFVCNLVVVTEPLISSRQEDVRALVQGAARAGRFASLHPDETAKIVARHWNQDEALTAYVLKTPEGRVVYDRFVPQERELREIAELMVRFDLLETTAAVSGIVEDRFALETSLAGVTDLDSVLEPARRARESLAAPLN